MKVVVNKCFGGFGLSKEAYEELGKWDTIGGDRTDPRLVACVEKLGMRANGPYAKLEVLELPDDVSFYIDEYDGFETVRETHRAW